MKPGDRVTWRHTPRGGYGFVSNVPARVVRVGPKLVRIEALRRDRTWKQVSVRPEKLQPRATRVPEDD